MKSRLLTARLGAVAVLVSMAAWFLAPTGPDSSAPVVRARQDDWQASVALRRPVLTAEMAEVAGASFWGAQIARKVQAADQAPEDLRWRVGGLYGSGNDRQALIVFANPGKNPQYVKPGDTLPSGHKITSIQDNELCVQIGKRVYRLPIQRSEP